MGFTYENQGNSNYLVYRLSPEEQVDTFSLGMLRNNQIEGILPVTYTQIDDQRFFKYNISSKVSVHQFFSGLVTKKRLLGVFEGICDALMQAEDYMLPSNMFAVDAEHLEYVYAGVSTCKAAMIFVPVVGYDNHIEDWGNFFKSIIFTNRFDQEENNDYVAKIISFLNGNVSFSAEAFKRLIGEINNETASPRFQTNVPYSNRIPEHQTSVSNRSGQNAVPNSEIHSAHVQNNHQEYAVHSTDSSNREERRTAQGVIQGQKNAVNSTTTIPAEAAPAEQDAKVTMWTLLTHYNKENAEAYKRQKREKKKSENTGKVKETKVGFKVPGQQVEGISPVSNNRSQNPQSQLNETPQKAPVSVTSQNDYSGQSSYRADTDSKQQANVRWTQQEAFGDTTVLGAEMTSGDTTVLSSIMIEHPKVQAYLIRKKTNERVAINKEVFKIGKEKSYADYFIGDNTAISRSHANIIKNQDGYFIIDTNSKNHTYVNGNVIQSNELVALVSGATVQLANEEFDFIIE